MPHRALTNRLSILAMLVSFGLASNASALILTGGPAYTLPGGGSCTVAGVACQTGGATVSCTGVNLGGSHARLLRHQEQHQRERQYDDRQRAGFRLAGGVRLREQHRQLDHLHEHDDRRRQIHGTQPVNNQLVLTLTGGTASVVATGGFPASNSFGDIERVFRVTSSSFSIRADVRASNPFFGPGQACPAVYDPTSHAGLGQLGHQQGRSRLLLLGLRRRPGRQPRAVRHRRGRTVLRAPAVRAIVRSGPTARSVALAPICSATRARRARASASTCPPDDAPINGGNVCRTGLGRRLRSRTSSCTGVPGQGCPAGRRARERRHRLPVVGGARATFCDEPEYCLGIPGSDVSAERRAREDQRRSAAPAPATCAIPRSGAPASPDQGCPADVVAPPTTVCRAGSGDSLRSRRDTAPRLLSRPVRPTW